MEKITIEKAPGWRHCNCCNTDKSVFEVTFHHNRNQAVCVALCRSCILEFRGLTAYLEVVEDEEGDHL